MLDRFISQVDVLNDMTPEQVAGLAPDASSLKAAEGLTTARKWVSLHQGEAIIWGECQGSGSTPYQTAVSLDDLAFYCSCPSRKFPCKHALALLFIFSRQRDVLGVAPPPEWVTGWQTARAARAAKAAAKSQQPATDPAARAKRAARREQNIEEGLIAFERWLYDLVRQGLAATQNQPYGYWEGMAARLVDAQAPGLARLVRQLAGIPASGDNNWPERLLRHLALLHLLVQGYAHLERLPPERQADVRTTVGWSLKQEEVVALPGLQDHWLVLISDLYEGGNTKEMRQRAAALVSAGVQVIALLALNDEGAPIYDHHNAAQLAAMGIPAFACTLDLFPELMAAAINRQDVGQWAARHEIQLSARPQ